jgi:hypothetical protein
MQSAPSIHRPDIKATVITNPGPYDLIRLDLALIASTSSLGYLINRLQRMAPDGSTLRARAINNLTDVRFARTAIDAVDRAGNITKLAYVRGITAAAIAPHLNG